MRISDFKKVYQRATAYSQPSVSIVHKHLSPQEIAAIVDLGTAQLPFMPSCLIRSLVLWMLLRRHSFESSLCVGVRKDGEDLNAHTWIEYQGEVLNDQPDIRQRFAVFDLSIDQVMRMRFS